MKLITSDIKRFFSSFLLFVLLTLFADRLIGFLIAKLYYHQDSGPEYRTLYTIEKSSEKVMAFGSSRATHHYVSDLFTKKLNLSFYNAGRDGNFILYSNAVLQAMKSRHLPDIIILDVVNREFEFYQDSYDRLSVLFPFYRNHPEIKDIIALRGSFEGLKMLSHLYPFNSMITGIIAGNMEFNIKRKQDFGGYQPVFKTINRHPFDTLLQNNYVIDSNKVKAYQQFISICKENNLRVFVVSSPYYDFQQNTDTSIQIAKRIASEYSVEFWDLCSDTSFTGKQTYFYDFHHLNDAGARRYSEKIANGIISHLNGFK